MLAFNEHISLDMEDTLFKATDPKYIDALLGYKSASWYLNPFDEYAFTTRGFHLLVERTSTR